MIILIGLPGSGKSTVGRQLARRLERSFIDSDHEIEQRLGSSIREFFEREGEAAFRDVEQRVIAELTSREAGAGRDVLATGGGVVLRPANRLALRSSGTVVYLRAYPEDLQRRLRHDRQRPLLQVDDPLQRLRDLYALRDPLYRETAHIEQETGRPSVTAIVSRLIHTINALGAGAAQAPLGAERDLAQED